MANGLPAGHQELVGKLGAGGGAMNMLDIDIESNLDCRYTDLCYSQNFAYDVFCKPAYAPNSCIVRAWRILNPQDTETDSPYRIEWARRDIDGTWAATCHLSSNATAIQKQVCQNL